MNLEFRVQTSNGLYLCSYRDGLLNVADYRANMVKVQTGVPVSEVHNILTAIMSMSGDETALTSLIKYIASQGTPIKRTEDSPLANRKPRKP